MIREGRKGHNDDDADDDDDDDDNDDDEDDMESKYVWPNIPTAVPGDANEE